MHDVLFLCGLILVVKIGFQVTFEPQGLATFKEGFLKIEFIQNCNAQVSTEGFNTGRFKSELPTSSDPDIDQFVIRNKVKPVESSALKDVTFKVKNKTVRMTVYQDTIRISCKGMDSLGIEEKLQNALKTLL